MTKDQIYDLINSKLIETQICGILIENEMCEYIQKPKHNKFDKKIYNRFSNLKILEPYATKLNYKPILKEDIKALRNLYPENSIRKGDINVIEKKMLEYLVENPSITYDTIYKALEQYVSKTMLSGSTEYLIDLNNMFYKQEKSGNVGLITKSPITTIIEDYMQINNNIKINSSLKNINNNTDIEI